MAKKSKPDDPLGIGDNSNEHLRSFSERINNLLDEKDRVAEDLKEVYAEAKSDGYKVKFLRKAISISRKDRETWQTEQEEIDTFLAALGAL